MRCLGLATLLAFATAGSGCTIHHQMARPLTAADVTRAQEALDTGGGAWIEYGQPAEPTLIGTVQRGNYQQVRAAGAQPSLIVLTDDPQHAVPLEHVRSIQVNRRWLGTLEGLGVGFLSGALVGALLAPQGKSDCNPSDDNCWGLDFSGMILGTSIVVGSLIGSVIGVAVGQRYLYTF